MLKRLALLIFFLCLCVDIASAHTFDTTDQVSGSSNPQTLSYTCGSGTIILVVGLSISSNSARGGGAPTYNSIAMTQADQTRTGGSTNTSTELWYLLYPPTGSAYTISVPNTGTLTMRVIASSYKAAAGKYSKYDTAGGATDPGTTQTSSSVGPLTVSSGGVAVDILRKSSTGAATESKTKLYAGGGAAGQYELLTGTSTTFTWSWATAGYFATSVVAFKEVALTGSLAITTTFTGTLTNTTSGAMTGSMAIQTGMSGTMTNKVLMGSMAIQTTMSGTLVDSTPFASDTFEGTGSDQTWTKSGTGSNNKDSPLIIDVSSHVTRDSATEEMQVSSTAGNTVTYTFTESTQRPIVYSKVDWLMPVSSNANTVFALQDSSGNNAVRLGQSSGTLTCYYYSAGSEQTGDYHAITANTRYRLDLSYDVTNHLYSCSISDYNDTLLWSTSGSLSGSQRAGVQKYAVSVSGAYSQYYDNFSVAATTPIRPSAFTYQTNQMLPKGNAITQEWSTYGSCSGYTCVNTATPDGSKYIWIRGPSSSTEDLFTIASSGSDLPTQKGRILGIQLWVHAKGCGSGTNCAVGYREARRFQTELKTEGVKQSSGGLGYKVHPTDWNYIVEEYTPVCGSDTNPWPESCYVDSFYDRNSVTGFRGHGMKYSSYR